MQSKVWKVLVSLVWFFQVKIPHYVCMAWWPLVLQPPHLLNALFDSHRNS